MTRRIDEAIRIIKMNDRGGYTVPTNRLYPYQWNWILDLPPLASGISINGAPGLRLWCFLKAVG